MASAKVASHEISRQPQSIQLKTFDDKATQQISSFARTSRDEGARTQGDLEVVTPPISAALALQRWNEPRGNIGRFVASFYSMFVYGLSDAAPGALVPRVSSGLLLRLQRSSLIPMM